jgi:hypothetical protein
MNRPWDETPNGAILSEDGVYRYALWRTFELDPELALRAATIGAIVRAAIPVRSPVRPLWPVIVGLNPSTADASKNDNTIRKEIAFCKSWGYARLLKINVFGYRETSPAKMFAAQKAGLDIMGPENRDWMMKAAAGADLVLCAWGVPAGALGWKTKNFLKQYTTQLAYLKLNQDGSPAHPLYQPGSLRPQAWR